MVLPTNEENPMFRYEATPVEYHLHVEDNGYAVEREGVRYDFIPFEFVRIFVDEETLLQSYLDGEFAHMTDSLPPMGVQAP